MRLAVTSSNTSLSLTLILVGGVVFWLRVEVLGNGDRSAFTGTQIAIAQTIVAHICEIVSFDICFREMGVNEISDRVLPNIAYRNFTTSRSGNYTLDINFYTYV
jgi:hypothetical protein